MNIEMHMGPEDNAMLGIPAKRKKPNLYYQANELEKQKKFEEAAAIYEQLLTDHFGNSAVLACYGMCMAQMNRQGVAHMALSTALKNFDRIRDDMKALGIELQEDKKGGIDQFMSARRAELMNAIGTTWKNENKTEQARYWFERADRELPNNPDIINNMATLFINEGKPVKAMELLDRAIAIAPEHNQARWNRALAYLETGDYARGFDEYGWGKRAEVRADRNYSNTPIPEWDGSPGARLVVYGEQGIGDEIMFASVLPDVIQRCEIVVFDCHKKLHRLFCNSFGQLDIYGTREDAGITWPLAGGKDRYRFTHKIAIGDMARFFRRKIEDFPGTPYIKPTTEAELRWAQRLNALLGNDGKPVIGLNWIGGHKKTRVEVRSLTLEQMLPILQQDAHFVSLQYTPCEDEIFEFEQQHGIKIHHWPEASYNDHYDETGGLVANLDLVVTCCSSVVHLAGSMGTPVWCLTPSRPAWRYRLDLDYMPWYGQTVTLFRQKPDTIEWEPVVAEVADNLRSMLAGISQKE